MKTLLWVNACMRGEGISRTDGLCRVFLENWKKYHPDGRVVERDLTGGDMPLLTGVLAAERDRAVTEGRLDSPLLEISREFAQADYVVIGAPYWDLSFPAVLKVYLEWASTVNVTFHYPHGAPEGLCRADKLLYITTGGGAVEGRNFGFDYVKALAAMFGISDSRCVCAEMTDAVGGPGAENLERAAQQLEELAKDW